MSKAAIFDETFYLRNNSSVASAVALGHFSSGLQHFQIFGGKELRAPNELFDPTYYILNHPDVAEAVTNGLFQNAFEHFQLFGEIENRAPSKEFEGFDPSTYIEANEDVMTALDRGLFRSALEHFIDFGQFESRAGTGFAPITFNLTTKEDIIIGSLRDDIILSGPGTLSNSDYINGGGGVDELRIIAHTEEDQRLALPGPLNLLGLERLSIQNEIHQTIDFSKYPSLRDIELLSGVTRNNETLIFTLSGTQSLKLGSITDGDITSPTSLFDGGIVIDHGAQVNELNLTLDDFGSPLSTEYVSLDLAGIGLKELKLSTLQTSFMLFSNSGGRLDTLHLAGSGSLSIEGVLPSSITKIITTESTADLTFTLGNKGVFYNGGEGVARLVLTGGTNDINTYGGSDHITARGGVNTMYLGGNNDTLKARSGTNYVFMSTGEDKAEVSGGINTIHMQAGRDLATISGGSNSLETGPGQDMVIISGGNNNINLGEGNDTLFLSSGGVDDVDTIDLGAGSDMLFTSAGNFFEFDSVDGGADYDTLVITQSGVLSLPGGSGLKGIEKISISIPIHQSLDFSVYQDITDIELKAGITVDGQTIVTTLNAGQGLTLQDFDDGDTAAASLADGGLKIASPNTTTSLSLTLNNVGPAVSTLNENVHIDIAGAAVATLELAAGNDSFIVLSNSGNALQQVNITGSGTMAVGSLPNSVTGVNGAAATANLILTLGTGSNTIIGGSGNDEINLTGGTNDVKAGPGDDTIQIPNNLAPGDKIDGEAGTDTIVFVHTGLASVPSTANLTSIERLAISDTVHQTLNFSALTTITEIELDSGTTVNGGVITTTIGSGQSLTLDSITDGDTAAASLGDGGIAISQPGSVNTLDLTIDDLGPSAANTNENLFLDVAGTGVTTINLTTANDNFVSISNSGGAAAILNITGAGTLHLAGALADSIRTISGENSTANITLTAGTSGTTVNTGAGNDTVTITNGTNTINTRSGSNVFNASNGVNNISMGDDNDNVAITGGTNTANMGNGTGTLNISNGINNITMGSGTDNVTISGGVSNTVDLGNGSGILNASNGANNITMGSGSDNVTLTGGTNTANMGNGTGTLNISNGINNITMGSGTDSLTLTGGTNTINSGNGTGTLNISNGTNNITMGSGTDNLTISNGNNTVDMGSGLANVNASGGTNNITTGSSGDNITLSGGTNVINSSNGNDTITLGGQDTINAGAGNDVIDAAASLTTADSMDGGSGNDTFISTVAITDAIAARISDFEIFDIKGGGGLTHDISNIAGLTSLKVSGALTGAVVITDLADTAEVDISTAIGNNLTINQINSAGGSDTITVDFSGGTYTTGGSIIAPNIETVTLKTSQSNNSTKTLSEGTFAGAGTITIEATRGNLTILNLNAVNMDTLDLSSSNKNVSITTGADVFSQAFTFSGGSRNDTLDLDGATVAAGTVLVVGKDQDVLILNSDAVSTTVRTDATESGDAFSILDDASTANTASFTSASDRFDYNGSLSHGGISSVVAASGASLQAAVAADDDATVYVIVDPDGDNAFESALNSFADNVSNNNASNNRANALETRAQDSGLLSYSGLDTAFASGEVVLIAIDLESNEEATVANNGGTAVYRFENTNTTTVDTVLSTELELIGVFQDAALATGDFI